jgi:dCTP deaminase
MGNHSPMAILSDKWIRNEASPAGMIEPFVESQRREGCISYGLSSYGYDARVADEFKIFTNVDSAVVDPKDFASNSFVDRKTDVCVIPPNSFALARTVEYFRVPRDVLVICLGKSTYARCGIIVNVTPLEPGWEGHVTLEFSNTTPLPAKIYANEGACQFLFLQGNEPCEVSYADRSGEVHGPARRDAAQALRAVTALAFPLRHPELGSGSIARQARRLRKTSKSSGLLLLFEGWALRRNRP